MSNATPPLSLAQASEYLGVDEKILRHAIVDRTVDITRNGEFVAFESIALDKFRFEHLSPPQDEDAL